METKPSYPKNELLTILPIALVVQIASTAPPILLGQFVDKHLRSPSTEWQLIFAIMATSVGIFAAEIWLSVLLAALSKKIILRGYLESMGRLLRKERLLFERVKIGEMIDTFSRYIGSLENTVTAFISGLAPAAIGALAVATAIGYIVGPLALVMILTIHSAIFAASLALSARYGRDLKVYTKTCYELSDVWVELLGVNKVIQNEYAFGFASNRLSASVSRMTDAIGAKAISEGLARSFMAFGQTFSTLIITIVLVTIIKESFSFGSILAVLTLNGMLHLYSRIMSEFLLTSKSYSAYKADFQRIDSAQEYPHPGVGIASKGYDALGISQLAVIKEGATILEITKPIQIGSREKVAIIGLSGAGKSTLISLLLHSNKQYQKYVSLGGTAATELSSSLYQQLVRICFQESDILSGSGYSSWFLRDGHAEAPAILREMNLPDDIIDGSRTLEPYSGNISGGEAKRLNVARLLIAPGLFNVLDEPTTGLNPSLSRQVWDVIFKRLEGYSMICATHDLENLGRFDRVLLIAGGKIVADRRPADLVTDDAYLQVKDKL